MPIASPERDPSPCRTPHELLPPALREPAASYLATLGPELEAADPLGTVSARSRLLCAALGELAVAGYEALGGSCQRREVGLAAASLSLLTKIDDEVIDSRAFHGGSSTDRKELRARTRAFLAPTLRSIQSATACSHEPRCAFAAMVGRRLRGLSQPNQQARLTQLLDAIALGWEVQVEAVAVLSSEPAAVPTALVSSTTRAISGAWLSMMVLVGMLPADAARPVSEREVTAIWDWGAYIQRADALCDLAKDQRDGLVATFVARRAFETGLRAPELAALYAHVAALGIDTECVPRAAERTRLGAELAGLGRVHGLLSWIHDMLFGRYLASGLGTNAHQSPREEIPCSAL